MELYTLCNYIHYRDFFNAHVRGTLHLCMYIAEAINFPMVILCPPHPEYQVYTKFYLILAAEEGVLEILYAKQHLLGSLLSDPSGEFYGHILTPTHMKGFNGYIHVLTPSHMKGRP